MWDELSLMPNLSFNESRGCIHGSKSITNDMGENERSNEIAEHVHGKAIE
jgi:hypothetical protein